MKKIVFIFLAFSSGLFAQSDKWYDNEKYDIIRDIDSLKIGNILFIKRMVNDTAGYYKGAYLDVYENFDGIPSHPFAYPDIVLKYYNFDFLNITPEEFPELKYAFIPGYRINGRNIVIIQSHKHGASHVPVFYHVFSISPSLKYLGKINWFYWDKKHYGKDYFISSLMKLTK